MFKIGDKVRAFGVDGVVVEIDKLDKYPVHVKFDHGNLHDFFTLDGKLLFWHKEPSLVLVERAEKFEEVVGYLAVCKSLKPISTISIGSIIRETKEEVVKLKNAIGYQEIKYFRKVE